MLRTLQCAWQKFRIEPLLDACQADQDCSMTHLDKKNYNWVFFRSSS
jgi:hypothetical protein